MDTEIVDFVPCPSCKREVAICRREGPRARLMWYQAHRLKRGDARLCPKSGIRLSPIDALAFAHKVKLR